MQESSQSDTQSDVTAQPLGLLSDCPVSATACSSSPQAKRRADGSMSPVGDCDGLEFALNDFVSEAVPLSCDSDASECGLYADDSSVQMNQGRVVVMQMKVICLINYRARQ